MLKCQLAEDWDRKHGKSVAHHEVIDGTMVPKDRPCDWCGKTVERGYIHKTCERDEAKVILDLIM